MYNGWQKEDPLTTKQLPVEANVLEYIAQPGREEGRTSLDMAVRELVLVAFYYLLHIGEYTVKRK